jgi:hypothetical protein
MQKTWWFTGGVLGLGLLLIRAPVSMGDAERNKASVVFEDSFIKLTVTHKSETLLTIFDN